MKCQGISDYGNSYFTILFSIVFLTDCRCPTLTKTVAKEMERVFGQLCANAGCTLLELSVKENYSILTVEAHPNIAPSRLVNTLKTISSREIRRRHKWPPGDIPLWQRSYLILSVGKAPEAVVEDYIASKPPFDKAGKGAGYQRPCCF